MKLALKSLVLVPILISAFEETALSRLSPPQANVAISGTLTGRVSKQPLAKTWVCLGRLGQDADGKDNVVTLTEYTAVTDDSGRFQIKGAAPGTYTLVFRPAPATAAKGGGKIAVTKLQMGIKSFMPMLRDQEVGTATAFAERPWTTEFTLLKGHTLYAIPLGSLMKIWNASVRSGRQGPIIEMRRNQIWRQDIQKDTQLKFEAWSF